MISCFPDGYPDELFYSLCARFYRRVQYPNKKNAIRELLGDSASVATVDFPNNLGHLVSVLPKNTHYTVQYLIDKHTLLPFYSPFILTDQVDNLRMNMESGGNSSIHMRSGVTASTIQSPKFFRYCPECLKEDRDLYGESYWHRLHQIPGVKVCPKHHVFLTDSQVRTQNARSRYEFISLDTIFQPVESTGISLQNPHHKILLKIAEGADWLLQNSRTTTDLEVLAKRYRRLLADRGLATYSGKVWVSKLIPEFIQFFSHELLEQLECEIDIDSQHNWLNRLVRSPRGSQHPIRHLLLIEFLGHTVESFFDFDKVYSVFGQGPWPCLNKAATHYHKRVISHCEITYSKEHGKPIGTFSCSCGFTYARTGPDKSDDDFYKISKIIQFGSEWEASLQQGWYSSTLSLRRLANRLGVDPATVKLHAARLGLPFPRQGKRQTNRSQRSLRGSNLSKSSTTTVLEMYRNEWLMILGENPHKNRTLLSRKFQRVYTWLRRNDSDWLKTNQPPRKTPITPPPRVNWQQRDIELASIVLKTAQRLKSQSTKPMRLTIATIARETGHLALIQKHLNKLPATKAILSQWVETREQFALRRIEWVFEYYSKDGIVPSKSDFIRRAGLRPEIRILPEVQVSIEKKLQLLRESVTQIP